MCRLDWGFYRCSDASCVLQTSGQRGHSILAFPKTLTIVLIEHDMSLVMKVCDRIYVLDYGKEIVAPRELKRGESLGEKRNYRPASMQYLQKALCCAHAP